MRAYDMRCPQCLCLTCTCLETHGETWMDRMDRIAVYRAKAGRTAKARAAIYGEWFVDNHGGVGLFATLCVQELLGSL